MIAESMRLKLYGLMILFAVLGISCQTKSFFPFAGSVESGSGMQDNVERLLIHLHNVSPGNRTIPGSNGFISLERRRFRQHAQTLDAMASFYQVPSREGYTITGRFQSSSHAFDNPMELWGIWEDIEVSSDSTEFIFTRNMPYILDVQVSYDRNNMANPSLQTGEELFFTMLMSNPSSEPRKVIVFLKLRNQRTGKITVIERDMSLNPFERRVGVSFSFSAEEEGEYHFAPGIFLEDRINEWTDCWDWSPNPLFFVASEHRTLEFSGYHWDVKAGFGNPGGNLWSNDTNDVWIDDRGRLNLTLTKKENGRWYATEVISQETFEYGTFTFYLDAEPAEYDPHVVAGIFLYQDENTEIDLEFSRWGDKENYQFGNYVIQPADYPGNQFIFPVLTSGSYTTHQIIWKPDEVVFVSWHGHHETAPEDRIIAQWQYTGRHIPPAGDLRLFFNLWLFRGIEPKSDLRQHLTVAHFTYQPLQVDTDEKQEQPPD